MAFDERKTGYRFTENRRIEFYCEKRDFEDLLDNEDVYISGTFNSWLNTGDSSWKLSRKVNKGIEYFVLEKKFEDVMIPGNTGFPEFQFFGLSSNGNHVLKEKNVYPEFSFHGNKLVIQTEKDAEEIKALNERKGFIKSLKDFDLNCPACRSDISNVRIVPGTNCLFRGYNPFKKSKSEYDTENERINLVLKAFELYGIKCDITLNGYEGAVASSDEVFPEIIQKIEKNGNRLCVNIDYNLVYFHPEAVDYSVALRTICQFIINHEGPYYIHCRLGSDRTGVTCGILAALCGASWNKIAHDYERTSNVGIAEFRNRRLLSYSLSKLIGHKPEDDKNLAHSIQSYFLKENILTMKEMEKLVERLNKSPRKKETDFFNFTENHICAKKDAKL